MLQLCACQGIAAQAEDASTSSATAAGRNDALRIIYLFARWLEGLAGQQGKRHESVFFNICYPFGITLKFSSAVKLISLTSVVIEICL